MEAKICTGPNAAPVNLTDPEIELFFEHFLPYPGPAFPAHGDLLDPELPEIEGDYAVYTFANGGCKADTIRMPLCVAPLIEWTYSSSPFPHEAEEQDRAVRSLVSKFSDAGWDVQTLA